MKAKKNKSVKVVSKKKRKASPEVVSHNLNIPYYPAYNDLHFKLEEIAHDCLI